VTSFLSASSQKGEVPYQEVRTFEILFIELLIDYRGEKHVVVISKDRGPRIKYRCLSLKAGLNDDVGELAAV
jgi:hypothetical protein